MFSLSWIKPWPKSRKKPGQAWVIATVIGTARLRPREIVQQDDHSPRSQFQTPSAGGQLEFTLLPKSPRDMLNGEGIPGAIYVLGKTFG